MIKVTWLERVGWNRSSVRNVMCIGQTTTKFEASIPRNLRESDILHSFWSAFMCEGVRDREREGSDNGDWLSLTVTAI